MHPVIAFAIFFIIWHFIMCILKNNNRSSFTSTNSSSRDLQTVMWFYNPGCHHCKKMKDSWFSLKDSGLPSNYRLHEIDTSQKENKSMCDRYSVNGVPYIIKINSAGITTNVYDGDRSTRDMRKWILG